MTRRREARRAGQPADAGWVLGEHRRQRVPLTAACDSFAPPARRARSAGRWCSAGKAPRRATWCASTSSTTRSGRFSGWKCAEALVDAPKSLRSQLSPGARYQWRVARVDENGDESRRLGIDGVPAAIDCVGAEGCGRVRIVRSGAMVLSAAGAWVRPRSQCTDALRTSAPLRTFPHPSAPSAPPHLRRLQSRVFRA